MENVNKTLGYIFRISITLAHKTLIFLLKLIELILKTFFALVAGTAATQAATTQHNASFKDNPGELVSFWNKGFRVSDKAFSLETSSKHLAVFAPSGGGKTLSLFANTLLSANGEKSFITRDPASQLYNLCSGQLAQKNYRNIVINVNHALLSSGAFNPIGGKLTNGELNRLAEIIVSSAYQGSTGDPYWQNSAKELCFVLLRLLKAQPEEYHTLYNLKRMVEAIAADEQSLDRMVIAQAYDDDFTRAYAAILATPDKTKLNTISTLKNSLIAFSDNDLAKVSATSTFDWSELRTQPTAVFIVSSVLDDKYLALYQNLLFYSVLNQLMKEIPSKDALPVQVLVDEASTLTLGNSFLSTALSNCRKYGVHLALAYQSPAQLEVYPPAERKAILANIYSSLFYPGQTIDVAKSLEETLGKTTITDEKGTRTEPLMSAANIRTMQGKAILLCGNHPAILLDIKPYYTIWRFKERSKIPPVPIVPIPQQTLAKLPL